MRKIQIVAASSLAFGICLGVIGMGIAYGADQPASPEQSAPSPLAGCYAELSGAGTFLAAGDRVASGALGAGCTAKVFNSLAIVGGGFRQEFGNPINAGELYGRLGLKINPHVDVYGLALWKTPNWSLMNTGSLYTGAGVETNLFSDRVSLFAEGAVAVSKIGASATKDDVLTRVGIRFWLQ